MTNPNDDATAATLALMAQNASNPDQAAKDYNLARRFGTAPAVVAAQRDAFKRSATGEDAQAALAGSPRTARFLADRPAVAPVIQDDLDGVTGVEAMLADLVDGAKRVAKDPIGTARAALLSGVASFDRLLLGTSEADQQVNAMTRAARQAPEKAGQALKAGAIDLGSQATGAVQLGVNSLSRQTSLPLAAGVGLWAANALGLGDGLGQVSADLKAEADATAPQVDDPTLKGALSGIRSLPTSAVSTLLALAGGVASGSAKVAGAIGSGAGGVLTAGGSYTEAKQQGLDESQAQLYAVIQGGLEAATEYLPERFLVGDILKQVPLGRMLGKQIVVENVGEQIATLTQDFTTWAMIDANKGKTFGDFLDERPGAAYETLIATTVMAGLQTGIARVVSGAAERLVPQKMEAARSVNLGELLDNTIKVTQALKTLKRDPETVREAIDAMADGTDVDQVFLSPQAVESLAQSGLPLETLLPSAAGQDALEAIQTGRDIAVPIGELMTAAAQEPALWQALKDNVKVDPNDMTRAEAQEFMASDEAKLIADEIDKAAAARDAEQAIEDDRAAVEAKIIENIGRMGRYSAPVVRAYAAHIGNFYAVLGQRLGKTATEVEALYPLNFKAQAPTGDGYMGQDRVNGAAGGPEGAPGSVAAQGGPTGGGGVPRGQNDTATPAAPPAQGENDGGRPQQAGDGGRRAAGGSLAPLPGAPTVEGATGPDPRLAAVAQAYAERVGIPHGRQAFYAEIDPEFSRRLAQAYEDMAHAPNDPEVAAAYAELIRQTRAQYDALVEAGYVFYFYNETNDPYAGNPWNAMRDLRANQRMAVFETGAGFGTLNEVENNPLLADTGLTWGFGSPDGEQRPVTANDLFRAVHDAFGHGLEGAGFRARGEENAWQAHAKLFTGSALAALTSETRGQNSWLNFGPYGEQNQTARVEDTVFADQKTGLLPPWAWQERVVPVEVAGGEELMQGANDVGNQNNGGNDQRGTPGVVAGADQRNPGGVGGNGLSLADIGFDERDAIRREASRRARERALQSGRPLFVREGATGADGLRGLARFTPSEDGLAYLAEVGGQPVVFDELDGNSPEARTAFRSAILAAKESLGAIGAQVSVRRAAKYKGARLFMSPDGLTGFAIDDGDIISAFSHADAPRGALPALMELAIQEGGNRLDAFDTTTGNAPRLPKLYSRFGFAPTERMAWNDQYRPAGWPEADLGQPDVVFMALGEEGALGETIEVDGQQRPTKNADGELIHPTREGVIAFWRWFGDSKVVDEQGRPVAVYHGTMRPGFDSFEASASPWKGTINEIGTWFSDNPRHADMFAGAANADRPVREGFGGGAVYPVYVAAQNPMMTTGEELLKLWAEHGGGDKRGRNGDAARFRAWLTASGFDGLWAEGETVDRFGIDGNYVVALNPEQVKSAIANRGTFDSNDPNILYQGDPLSEVGFYSPIERAVETSKLAKAPAAQWKATLEKTPGVKKEEIEWIGFFDWLDAQEGSVTREALLDFVQNNGVQVEEIIKESGGDNDGEISDADQEYIWDRASDDFYGDYYGRVELTETDDEYEFDGDALDTLYEAMAPLTLPDGQQPWAFLASDIARAGREGLENSAHVMWDFLTKRGTAILPLTPADRGGDTYAQQLKAQILGEGAWKEYEAHIDQIAEQLQIAGGPRQVYRVVPSRALRNGDYIEQTDFEDEDEAQQALDDAIESARGDVIDQYEQPYYDEVMSRRNSSTGDTQWSEYKMPGGEDYTELLLTLPAGEGSNPKRSPGTHWDEDGVVAHVRFDTRRDETGRKVLMIHEIQSDWHQAGKKQGYAVELTAAQRAEIQAQIADRRRQIDEIAQSPENEKWAESVRVLAELRDDKYQLMKAFQGELLAAQDDPSLAATLGAHPRVVYAVLEEVVLYLFRSPTRWLNDSNRDVLSSRAATEIISFARRGDFGDMPAGVSSEQEWLAPFFLQAVDLTDRAYSLARAYVQEREQVDLLESNPPGADKIRLLDTEARQLEDRLNGTSGIPDAPFKNEGYAKLAIRRMMRYAVDNGFQAVAWIRPEQYNGGQTGGDDRGAWFYDRNLVNLVNDIIKPAKGKTEGLEPAPELPEVPPFATFLAARVEQLRADIANLEPLASMQDVPEEEQARREAEYQAFQTANRDDFIRARDARTFGRATPEQFALFAEEERLYKIKFEQSEIDAARSKLANARDALAILETIPVDATQQQAQEIIDAASEAAATRRQELIAIAEANPPIPRPDGSGMVDANPVGEEARREGVRVANAAVRARNELRDAINIQGNAVRQREVDNRTALAKQKAMANAGRVYRMRFTDQMGYKGESSQAILNRAGYDTPEQVKAKLEEAKAKAAETEKEVEASFAEMHRRVASAWRERVAVVSNDLSDASLARIVFLAIEDAKAGVPPLNLDEAERAIVADPAFQKLVSDAQADHPAIVARDATARNALKHWEKIAGEVAKAVNGEQGNLGFDITPALKANIEAGLPLFQQQRGAFIPSQNLIVAFERADLSTILHEAAHFFLEVYMDVAAQPDAPQQIVNDMQAFLRWAGVNDLATWRSMPLGQRRDAHERFARGFEKKLMSGRSPSLRLEALFRTFRSWLVSVYRSMKNLNVKVSPEVSAVMDRMMATDQEIADMEAARSMAPLFAQAQQSGMSETEWKAYQALAGKATQEAQDELAARGLRDMQWLANSRAREIKRLQQRAKAIRNETRKQVTEEVMGRPVFRAMTFLKRGTIDGRPVEGAFKLAIVEVDAILGEAPGAAAAKAKLGFGKYGMLGKENGIHPQQVAELFGFPDAETLIDALINAPDPKAEIEGITEQRLLEEHGDLTDQTSIERAADKAIHSEARGRFIATELAALNKAVGKRKVLAQAAKSFAERTIARLRVRDLKPAIYSAAEARAAKASMEAFKTGNLATAAAEKRNQLVNFWTARAAIKAAGEIEAALTYLAKFNREGTRKAIDPEYRDQIDQLLERFDLRKGQSLKAIDKRKSLMAWVEKMREQGIDPLVPEELLIEAGRKSFRDMTVEEMRGLVDTIKNIEHLGRLKTKLLTAKRERDFQRAVDKAEAAIRDNATRQVVDAIESNRWIDKAASGAKSFFAMHRKLASLVRQMDGFKDGGIFWEILIRPMNAAGDKEAAMRADATRALARILKPITDAGGLRKKLFIPEIGKAISLEGRLAVALNMGNETNRLRVMEGDRWTGGQVEAILRTLTAEQWQTVQAVWDYVDSFWPQVREKELRVSGVAPEKVEAEAFTVTTADGQTLNLKGGYYPIKYDPLRSSKAEADNLAETVRQSMQGLYTRATTRRGHTKARVESVKRPIRKDLGVLFQHVTEVIHDLSWHEWLIDANRLMAAGQIDGAIRDHYGPEVLKVMKDAIRDIAVGDIPAQDIFESVVNHIRTGTSIAGMGWNLLTSLQQPLGLANTIRTIGPVWTAVGVGKVFADTARLNNVAKWVAGRSVFMASRVETQQREINEIRNKIARDRGGRALSAVQDSYFWMISRAQLLVDLPTWVGAYEKHMFAGEAEDRAVALADQAVIDAQGGGQIKDLAAVQRGGPMMKLWTNFYSFMNLTYNQLAEEVGELRLKGPKQLPYFLAEVALITFIPTTLGMLLRDAFKGDGGDDDEELAAKLAKENAGFLLGTMIGAREIGSMISSDIRYTSPAGLRFLSQLDGFMTQVEQGEADEALWKAANSVGGVVLHYPATQVDRTVRGTQALANGDTNNPVVLLTGPREGAAAAK